MPSRRAYRRLASDERRRQLLDQAVEILRELDRLT